MNKLSALPSFTVHNFFTQRGFTPDSSQLRALARLSQLHEALMGLRHRWYLPILHKRFFHSNLPRGVYLWGGVGRGKTLLMDSFFAALNYRGKRRIHFFAFMREIHRRLNECRGEADPLKIVAADIARQCQVLCLDEFQVTDVADAMILGKLLEGLFASGVVLLTTSNQAPSDLYPDGLQRINFLPTIALIESHLDVIEVDGGLDYRGQMLANAEAYALVLDGKDPLEGLFANMASGEVENTPLHILGRDIAVRARATGVVWFDFLILCGYGRSQQDYLEIATSFPVVLLSGVRSLTLMADGQNMSRRFTWLVDVMYDRRVKLIISANCPPQEIFPTASDGQQQLNLATADAEHRRTLSRLSEMSSPQYLGNARRKFKQLPG